MSTPHDATDPREDPNGPETEEPAGGLGDAFSREGRRLVDDLQAAIEDLARKRQHEAAARSRVVAASFRSMSATLREGDEPSLAAWADDAADVFERLAVRIEERKLPDADDLPESLRGEPAAFLGGAFLLGAAAGWLLNGARRDDD